MPKGPPPRWTQRDCRFDHVVAAAVAESMDKPLTYRGIDKPDRAKEIRQGVYRCARHRGISVAVSWLYSGRETTMSAEWPPDKQPDGTYTLKITLYSKARARKRHLATYGTDRANWPYDPRQPKSQADIDAWAEQGLDQRGHRTR